MLPYATYSHYPDGEDVIHAFFDHMMFLCSKKLPDYLDGYLNHKGNALNDNQVCYFAGEFPIDDEEYFGDHGVAVYLYVPADDDLRITLLDETDFYHALLNAIERYEYQFSQAELKLIYEKLTAL